ncbi:hypothetical protein AGMMS50276_25180 [Synergistales bacterium]|nr:hypothetical protein AGMMS50276_25180 [Synergistales bacterium]
MNPHELRKILEKKYPQILFKEGTKHTFFSVNGGLSWNPMGPRHSTRDIRKGTMGSIMRGIKEQLELLKDDSI